MTGSDPERQPVGALTDQVDTLVRLGYPALLGIDEARFRAALDALRRHPGSDSDVGPDPQDGSVPGVGSAPETGSVPVVLVVTSAAVPTNEALGRLTRHGKEAVEKLYPRQPDYFQPISSVHVPRAHAYLAFGIERGDAYLNVTPDDALISITERGRTPLTIDEGVALLTHYPEFIQRNRCFSLLGSRGDDRRVPALWLSDDRPKLGWCWAGNPHTWLGSASCVRRSAGVRFDHPVPGATISAAG